MGGSFCGLKYPGKVRHSCRLQFVFKAEVIFLNARDILVNESRLLVKIGGTTFWCIFLEGKPVCSLSRICNSSLRNWLRAANPSHGNQAYSADSLRQGIGVYSEQVTACLNQSRINEQVMFLLKTHSYYDKPCLGFSQLPKSQ